MSTPTTRVIAKYPMSSPQSTACSCCMMPCRTPAEDFPASGGDDTRRGTAVQPAAHRGVWWEGFSSIASRAGRLRERETKCLIGRTQADPSSVKARRLQSSRNCTVQEQWQRAFSPARFRGVPGSGARPCLPLPPHEAGGASRATGGFSGRINSFGAEGLGLPFVLGGRFARMEGSGRTRVPVLGAGFRKGRCRLCKQAKCSRCSVWVFAGWVWFRRERAHQGRLRPTSRPCPMRKCIRCFGRWRPNRAGRSRLGFSSQIRG